MNPRQPALAGGLLAGAGVLAAGGILLLRRFDPDEPGGIFLPCLFRHFTGLYCPGCGMTRALHALAHGDLSTALAMNPLGVLAIPVLAVLIAQALGYRLLPLPVMRVLGSARLWLILLPAYWVARNLPWPPFAWLAPG